MIDVLWIVVLYWSTLLFYRDDRASWIEIQLSSFRRTFYVFVDSL